MAETLEKLRPDRDLQCYFERPSAIAAMHNASAGGFTVSGTWRQQFDWAVIEWNRDNVFEHPMFRYLPDGDLRGLVLSYEETRVNCIPFDSDLYPTVDWPYLRVWADDGGAEQFYQVRLSDYAATVEGAYSAAQAELELTGTPAAGDYAGISFLGENHTYQLLAGDTLESAAQAIVDSVNAFSTQMTAVRSGAKVRLTVAGATAGANGNRVGVYGFTTGAAAWSPWWARFSGGISPSKWRVQLALDSLVAIDGRTVPAQAVRKMRWTYSADLQAGAFQRSEFQVTVSNWTVTGANRSYQVAGPGSRRIEDDDDIVQYSGAWSAAKGNYSGGTIHYTQSSGDTVSCQYQAALPHTLLLGARSAFNGADISISVDGQPAWTETLLIAGEDVLRRIPLGSYGPGDHRVVVTHTGASGSYVYFDFLEVAQPVTTLPVIASNSKVTLANDWDTDHSISLPAERTAWLIHSLGFDGRVNHYTGALWFYELVRSGHQYASATVDFVGTPEFSQITELRIGRTDQPPAQDVVISHVNRIGDSAETIAKAFELELNRGYTAIWAEASGARLTIHSRAMGADGNLVTVAVTTNSTAFTAQLSGAALAGGVDGDWRTDLQAMPRLNRAARDWSTAFFRQLAAYGLDAVAAFSMELQHGDPSVAAGIAQRYPSGQAVQLSTPALQTNFSPTSTAFWKQVYLDMAGVMAAAGLQPYLQFGEVQWWYFPDDGSGMPFYDDYTTSTFQARYSRPMSVITSNNANPSAYPEETEFLPSLIGDFTRAVTDFVRASHPGCRFEVLYPTDVNETAFNSLINYPSSEWTPQNLDNLKTESFTYTYTRDLNASRGTVRYGTTRSFAAPQRSFLVGIGDAKTTWPKEVRYAMAENVASIVLFALDQFCLIGYEAPLPSGVRRAVFLG